MLKTIIEFAPIFIALLALFISFATIYASKRRDVEYNKFNKLCLAQLEYNLDEIWEMIEKNNNKALTIKLNQDISKQLNDLLIKLISIKKIYKNIDVSNIQEITHGFSNEVLSKVGSKVSDLKPLFYTLKTDLLVTIYNYVLSDVFSFYRNSIRNVIKHYKSVIIILLTCIVIVSGIYVVLIISEIYQTVINFLTNLH